MEDDVDISALTIEQYIALIPNDIKPDIVNPKIGNDVEFEINANFIMELRRKLFTGIDNEDAYEHVRTVLEIVDLFHFPGVTHDAIMLRIQRSLYNVSAVHDPETHREVSYLPTLDSNISYPRISSSNGFIPLMTPTQALESIQVMADHSHDWYDEPTTRKRINDVLDNVDTIHESFKGEHLTKEYPLKKEDETFKHRNMTESLEETIIKFCEDTIKKQTVDDEKMRKILENTKSNIRTITTMDKENMKEPIPRNLSPTPFLGPMKEQIGDMDVGWDITSKDVERLRQFLTPTIHTLPNLEPIVQPYMLGPVYDRDKVAKEKK
ncbi:hypothetical protein Tco_0947891 [Tanacetum coccineum]